MVTQTDCPKSVRNHCVIDVFGGVFVLSRCFLEFFDGVGAFVIGLSGISSFFSYTVHGVFLMYINLTVRYRNKLYKVSSVLCKRTVLI